MNDFFKNKVFLITGATSGIGKETARLLLQKGAKVSALARKPSDLLLLKNEFPESLYGVKGDVTVESSCKSFIQNSVKKFKKIDGIIHCAGIGQRSPGKEINHSTLHKIMDTNFSSMVYLLQNSYHYLEKTTGVVAGISSIQGKIPLPNRAAYSAAKHALNAYLKSISIEENKIHFCIINFGYVNSGFSQNALKGDGSIYGKKSQSQEKGMSTQKAAAVILNAIKKRRKEITAAGFKEKLALFVYKRFPGLYLKLIQSFIKPD